MESDRVNADSRPRPLRLRGILSMGIALCGLVACQRPAAAPVELRGAKAVVAGSGFTCSLQDQAVLLCWGGGLGGDAPLGRAPREPGGAPALTRIAAGPSHLCGITSDHRVYCVGENGASQLGKASPARTAAGWDVPGLKDAVAVAVGNAHSCALDRQGAVWCWGRNVEGQCGVGRPEGIVNAATRVRLPQKALAIAAGGDATCAIGASRELLCWGDNRAAQLGQAASAPKRTPQRVAGVSEVARVVVAQGLHRGRGEELLDAGTVLARTRSGALWGWGRNDVGQLVRGGPKIIVAPRRLAWKIAGTALAAGYGIACASRPDGHLVCMGENSSLPAGKAPQASLTRVVEVAVGGTHVCARDGDGRIHCWGPDRNALGHRVRHAPLQPLPVLRAAPPLKGSRTALGGLGMLAIVGIVLGVLLVFTLVGVFLSYARQQRRRRALDEGEDGPGPP